ncbi:MAG: MarR family transcriptional regulator [Thermomicrobiales bacterium]
MARAETVNTAGKSAELTLNLVPRLTRWAQARIVDEGLGGDLSLRQLSALQMIEDDTTTLGDVAKSLMVTPAVVTGLIDRLERRGYVARVGSTGDRRRVYLKLTDSGREARQSAKQRLNAEVSAKMSAFSTDELKSMEHALTLLTGVIADLESERSSSRR